MKKFRGRKGIRVESEEAQDYVREANGMDQEEAEEISFVPSAISVPQKPLCRCDNQCSEKTLSFWQLASVVMKKGEGIIHNQFMPAMIQQASGGKRGQTVDKVAVDEFVEKKTHRGRFWKMMGKKTVRTIDVEHFCQERAGVKRFREEAEEERQAGIQGQ